jgi:hypothetical protein
MDGGGMTLTNKYAGVCYRCGQPVGVGEGKVLFERLPGLRWPTAKGQRNWTLIEHPACRIKFAGTNTHYAYPGIK